MNRKKKYDFAKLAFWSTMAFFIFLIGGVFGQKELYPYPLFEDALREAWFLIREQFDSRPSLLRSQRYEGDGVILHDPARAYEGYTLMEGYFTEGPELRLVDMSGNVVHRWPADFSRVWPNPSHVIPTKNVPKRGSFYHTQGMWALPDGSVVFNFAEKGTVKMDKCGTVQWTIDRMTHHSITPIPDGSFWIPVKGDVRDVPDALLLPSVSHDNLMKSNGWYEDKLMRVDSDGQIKKEISLLRALFDSGFESELYDANLISKLDPTHLNDIEVVTPALANKIESARVGDLLVSIRQMHMLAIVDHNTGLIKWHKIGPWVRQHDPDITSDGNIVVFNNGGWKKLSLNQVPGSNLITIDPANDQTSILYPRDGQPPFKTYIMGTSQSLPNGNRLIAETMAGRIFEIDGGGNIVWEYIKPYDDTHASMIESAIRYSPDYFQVRDWSCN